MNSPALQANLDALPPIPLQGFAPHVELDETGRVVFAPPSALDAEGNNLPRLRILLPQLIAIADELSDLLSRGNQAHAAVFRRLIAYRAQLTPDLMQLNRGRLLTEGLRLENAVAAAEQQIVAKELPAHNEDAAETLASLLQLHRLCVMATAEGPAMLADEARYFRTPIQQAEHQQALRHFTASISQDPSTVAPDVAETLSATVNQTGDTPEATRSRLLGEGLAVNIAITTVAGATIAGIVAGLATLGPFGIAAGAAFTLLAGKGLEKSQPFAEAIAAIGQLFDKARDLDPTVATTFLRDRLAFSVSFVERTKPSLRALARQGGRFAWLLRALAWVDASGHSALIEQNSQTKVNEGAISPPEFNWPPTKPFSIWQDKYVGLHDDTFPEMLSLPGGQFVMGSPIDEVGSRDDERPQRSILVPAFAIGRFAITFAQWDAARDAGADLRHPNDDGWGRGDRPVINVSWDDAISYCNWLNGVLNITDEYRLPTETEWEYACRAGTTSPFSFGEVISTRVANYDGALTYGNSQKGQSRKRTVPVGALPANPWRLHEVHGNVWEWVADSWHDDHNDAHPDGSLARYTASNDTKTLRGGSWFDDPRDLRSASRSGTLRDGRDNDMGFRVARTFRR